MDREFEGRDLEEALQRAAAELGIAEPELHYEIVEQGRRGVFGLGAKSVRIRVQPPLDDLSDPAPREDPTPSRSAPAPVSPQASLAVERTLQRMLDLMGLDLQARSQTADGGLTLELVGPDRQLVTQKNAELLLALQFLLNRMSRRAWPEIGRIRLAGDGEHEQRDEDVIERTREVAHQVAETGRPKALEPMNAYERRLVHLTVREFEGLTTQSEGQGPLKRVKIAKARSGGQRPSSGRRRRADPDPGSP